MIQKRLISLLKASVFRMDFSNNNAIQSFAWLTNTWKKRPKRTDKRLACFVFIWILFNVFVHALLCVRV